MEKKMTSGEIARKVGISQKAIRLYDEKGLLKPVDYSEGNYRLYDVKSILVLEKIIALKHIGFTLEEIYENLIIGNDQDIVEALNEQLEIMEEKKRKLERDMECIRGIIARSNGQPDWDGVAEIAKAILQDQEADENHYHALNHSYIKKDWYVRIYELLNLESNKNVLDLGCGFGKLWRNSWEEIPTGTVVTGVDLHGSWADDFDKFISENKDKLSKDSDIAIVWEDIECKETWENLNKKKYELVIANYLFDFIKDLDVLLERIVNSMTTGGVLLCNGYHANDVHEFWKNVFDELKLKKDFIVKKIKGDEVVQKEFESKLARKFAGVHKVSLNNDMTYDDENQVFEVLCNTYPESAKYLNENKGVLEKYFADTISEHGEYIVKNQAYFYKCEK